MHEWLIANPTKATKSNWQRFATNWLKSEQDKGGDMRGQLGKPKTVPFKGEIPKII